MSRRSKTDDWSSLVIAGLARDCTTVPPPGTAEIVQTDRTDHTSIVVLLTYTSIL